jgi:predicted dehydrogenase
MHAALKLGLLGSDPQVAAVAAAAARAGDTLVMACDLPAAPSSAAEGAGLPGDLPRSDSWEPLLDDRTCDAVLVGADGWSDDRAEAVRGLVQAGRTLLLGHPPALSMLWAYELDMIRSDSQARLIPFLPDRLHPFIARLKAQVEEAVAEGHPLGTLETITLERRMPDRSRETVLRQLARDVDLVRVLSGDPQRLATLGGTPDTAWPTLAVGFTGGQQVPVRWSVVRGELPSLSVTLVQEHGSTSILIPGDDSPWQWQGPATVATPPATAFDRGGFMLGILRDACTATATPRQPALIPAADWADAARAIELAETVPRSLAKGRAIDLHQEEYSEIGTFKGTMASLGCGIVLAALFILILAALVGGIAREAGWAFGERVAGAWPAVVLTALVLFLVLQVLPLLIGGSPTPAEAPPTATPGRPPGSDKP